MVGEAPRPTASAGPDLSTGSVIEARDCSIFYGAKCAINKISMSYSIHRVTALIGPSGCGKSTLLRALNRMNDNIAGARLEGSITYHGQDIYDPAIDSAEVRKRIGMVFQKPNPFPKTIFENVAFGPRLNGFHKKEGKQALADHVEECLKGAGLWDEVRDRLNDSALSLSGGQQQRLCIARAIANDPEVLLMDEPCSALDPISTARIEELIEGMRDEYSIVIVTHNMEQARRISDNTAFLLQGDLVEFNNTNDLFSRPKHKKTEDYITGRFG